MPAIQNWLALKSSILTDRISFICIDNVVVETGYPDLSQIIEGFVEADDMNCGS